MPGERQPLRIINTETRNPKGQSPRSDTYSVYLTLNRSLTIYEENLINTLAVPRPLGFNMGSGSPNPWP